MDKLLKSKKILKYAKKIILLNSKGGKCLKCGNIDIFQLVFHHIDSSDKDFTFGELKNNRLSIISEEIDKCIPLCQNCHREHHYNEENIYDRRYSKNIFLEYAGSKCISCGYSKCTSALTFHHRDTSSKLFSLGDVSKNVKFLIDLDIYIKDEIDKCDILCANCHVLEHSDIEFFENYKSEIYNKVENYKEKQSKINRSIVIEMYDKGITQIDIAKFFKASNGTISDILKVYKGSKIKIDKGRVIKMFSDGDKVVNIAKYFDVTRSSIYHIIKTNNIVSKP